MSKNTIAIADVASMLAELGIGLAQDFGLDETEVVEYLDSVCSCKTGINPQASKLLKEVKESVENEEEDHPTVTTALIEEWCQQPSKGGLSIKDLRAKTKECGVIQNVKGSKRADYRKALEGLVDEEDPEATEEMDDADTDTDADEPITPTKEQVEKWCQQPSKGGVSTKGLKQKAHELGVDVEGLTKRSDIKEALLGVVEEEPTPTVENKVRRNKELKCWVVEGTQLVVKSQKNHTVVGYLTKAGDLRNKLTKAIKTVAEERGLAVE